MSDLFFPAKYETRSSIVLPKSKEKKNLKIILEAHQNTNDAAEPNQAMKGKLFGHD